MKRTAASLIFTALCWAILASCDGPALETGVSQRLADSRAGNISNISYSLEFDLTGLPAEVESHGTVSFDARRRADVVLDFKAPEGSLLGVVANGDSLAVDVRDEHIVIPRKNVRKGSNELGISFLAGLQSLNVRNDFVYTLLVPDRARTLFPCFDQPDLKAQFNLTLDVPENWVAVSNIREKAADAGRIVFRPTEPLSTYLFCFVAGEFERLEASREGRTIAMYHRETDPEKLARTGTIFDLVFDSLEWMEEYTGVPYPFAKYDFIVLPDFQYGGMEHTGATLYNDKRIFLSAAPTTNELLNRASLIAHETAHMWFGDYVTMKWFNDVWTKEVFANWFASKMIRPQYPEVNHALSDLRSLYAPAYGEDRTDGRCAIQRPLDNLQNAGLIYCNTIYDKAPIVMEMLAEKVGPEAFRACLQEYLRSFAYGNAGWDDLIAIFDAATEENLAGWSHRWVKEAGMPEYSAGPEDELAEGRYWLPNLDGKGYGWYRPDAGSMEYIMAHWSGFDETARMSLLMTLYENSWHSELDRRTFVSWGSSELASEPNPLILNSLLSYVGSENSRLDQSAPQFCEALRALAADASRAPELRLLAFRQYYGTMATTSQKEEIYRIWKDCRPYPGLILGENDYTGMAYALMIALPEKAGEIASVQRSRITNPDRLETFDFVSRAASPDPSVRQELFDYLLAAPQNRRPESRVLSALSLLCHKTRREEAVGYILPALEALPEIQATGDIFFPSSWCRTLLANQHDNPTAQRIVDDFLASHDDMNPLLVNKILQAR